MAISYNGLWKLLIDKGMKKGDLCKSTGLSSSEIANDLIRFVDESYLDTNEQSLVDKGDFIFADTSEDVQGCGNFVYVDKQQSLFAG